MSPPLRPEPRLPPSFTLVALREAGDAFAHAQAIAETEGAGTLVWARRFDVAEFALVLEPQEPLRLARRALYPASNALALALAAHAPPELPITFDWPDAIRIDGALVGGVRLAWPAAAPEDEVPDWLVFGVQIRTVVMRAGEAGLRPLLGGLDESGFEELSPAALIEAFTRYFLRELDRWNEYGFDAAREHWLLRSGSDAFALRDDGDYLSAAGRRSLAEALAKPSWADPATGAPWL
jgi:biotin-(acetyl-CoA carboxylase) ligase